jgi:hypothetical protein
MGPLSGPRRPLKQRRRALPSAVLSSHPTPTREKRGPPHGLDLAELKRRVREYVKIQERANVLSVKFEETFRLFGAEDVVLRVKIDDANDPDWWVIGGASPMNLYSIRVYKTADEAFSLHVGIMLRLSDRNFTESREAPDVVGYDAFISHASEDKINFVRPLAKELSVLGFRVWFDEF